MTTRAVVAEGRWPEDAASGRRVEPRTPVDIAVITVIQAELDALRRVLALDDAARSKYEGRVYWSGSIRSALQRREFTYALTCIGQAGNSASAACTASVISALSPKIVVLVGIACGMRGKRKIGDVVFGESVVTYEPGAITATRSYGLRRLIRAALSILGLGSLVGDDTHIDPRPNVHEPPHALWQDVIAYTPDPHRLEALFARLGENVPSPPPGSERQYRKDVQTTLSIQTAVIASGEKLIRAADFFRSLRKLHGRIEVAEMEGAGFARACIDRQVDWLIVRGVSDFGDEFKNDAFHRFASAAASTALLDFLSNGLTLVQFHSAVSQILEAAHVWAKAVLESWEREHDYNDALPLPLTFRKEPHDRATDGHSLTLSDVTKMIAPGAQLVLEGVPGAGKTFSLISMASHLIREDTPWVALPLSLPALALSGSDIPKYLAINTRIKPEDIESVLASGAVVVLMDGWNEIPSESVDTVTLGILDTLRRFPTLSTVITTRDGIIPPIGGVTRLVVQALADDARNQYLAASKHADALGSAIRDDPRIDDLTHVPLFLIAASAALDTEGARVPTSKYGLLRAVIQRAEDLHAGPLRRTCGGHHRRYLQAIAVAMHTRRATSLALTTVIDSVSQCIGTLEAARTIAERPDAAIIVDALVSFHLLVRSNDSTLRFQHQQFQEWFATEQLHADLSTALPHDAVRLDQIAGDVCNLPHWEESLTLLLEQLRDENTGWSALASEWIVRTVYSLDAFFGASLLMYLREHVGTELRADIARHLRALQSEAADEIHTYAFACMLATRSPEFQDLVWPLLEHTDRNVRITTSRAVAPFPLEALGADWWRRVRTWNEETRGDFLGELIMNSDRRLATDIITVVLDEASEPVQHAILEALAFRGERELIRKLVTLWGAYALVSERGDVLLEMLPGSLITDLAALIETAANNVDDGPRRWHFLATLARGGNTAAQDELLRSAASAQDERSLVLFRRLLSEAAPGALMPWLLERLLQGSLWDWESLPYFKEFTIRQRDALIDSTLALSPTDVVRRGRLGWLAKAWPVPLGERLVRALLTAVRQEGTSAEMLQFLNYNVHEVPRDTLAQVVADLPAEDVSTAAEASAIIRVLPPATAGGASDDPHFANPLREALRAKILPWERFPISPAQAVSYRRDFVALLGIVGTPDDGETVLRLIAADDEHRRAEELATGRPYVLSDRSWYAGALARLGAIDVLVRLLRRSDYLGSASIALAQRLSPSGAADACAAVRTTIEAVLSTPQDKRDFHWRIEVSDALVALAKLGDRKVISFFDRLDPQDFFHWKLVEALEELAERGWVLPASEIGRLVTQIADRAMHGRYNNEPYLAARCAAVLLVSDSPDTGVELARTLLPANLYDGGDRLLRMLGQSKTSSAVQFLGELLNDNNVREHRYREVVHALGEHGSSAAHAVLLSELDRLEAESTNDPRAPRHALSAALFTAADGSPSVLAGLRERLPNLRRPHAIELATEALNFLVLNGRPGGASPSDLLTSIDDSRDWPIPFYARDTVEKTFIEHRPSGPSMFTLVPRSNQELRHDLFRMLKTDFRRSRSGRRLLILTENLRIERGRPDDEPRHPDYVQRNADVIHWTAQEGPPLR